MDFETLPPAEAPTANAAAAVLFGRPFVKVPSVLIRPGVLQGSKGALMYTETEVASRPWQWNGMPLVGPDHPKDTETGRHVSARSADVLDRHGIGQVLNARFKDGKLKADLWFDVALTEKHDKTFGTALLADVRSGRPVELSTGLFTQDVPVGNQVCPRTKKAYTHEARDFRPDHVAVLPRTVGACSVADGCGVGVNEKAEPAAAPAANDGPKTPDRKALLKVARWLARNGAMPGYGQVFVRGSEVWYVGGDGDEWAEPNLPVTKFSAVPGVSKVTYEAEAFPPKGEGWEQVVPKKRPRAKAPTGNATPNWVRLAAPRPDCSGTDVEPCGNCGGKGGKPGPCPRTGGRPGAGSTSYGDQKARASWMTGEAKAGKDTRAAALQEVRAAVAAAKGGKGDRKNAARHLGRAADNALRAARKMEARGDKAGAKNMRAAAYGFNLAAKHYGDGKYDRATAALKTAHGLLTGKTRLKSTIKANGYAGRSLRELVVNCYREAAVTCELINDVCVNCGGPGGKPGPCPSGGGKSTGGSFRASTAARKLTEAAGSQAVGLAKGAERDAKAADRDAGLRPAEKKALHERAAAGHDRTADYHESKSGDAHAKAAKAHRKAAAVQRAAVGRITTNSIVPDEPAGNSGLSSQEAEAVPKPNPADVEYLTANCDCWKKPGRKEALEGMDGAVVADLRKAAEAKTGAPAANAAGPPPVTLDDVRKLLDDAFRANAAAVADQVKAAAAEHLAANEKKDLVDRLVTANSRDDASAAAVRGVYDGLTLGALRTLAGNLAAPAALGFPAYLGAGGFGAGPVAANSAGRGEELPADPFGPGVDLYANASEAAKKAAA